MLNRIKTQFEIRSECWWPQNGNMDDEMTEQESAREREKTLTVWLKNYKNVYGTLLSASDSTHRPFTMHIEHKNSKSLLKTSISSLIVNTISGSRGAHGFYRPTGKQSCVYKVLVCCNDKHFLGRTRMDLQGFRQMKFKFRHIFCS